MLRGEKGEDEDKDVLFVCGIKGAIHPSTQKIF